MKKFIIFVSSLIAICSCAKVAEQENISDVAAFEEWNIIGQIETPESKTSYTDMGTYYKFAWVKGDVVGFQLYKKDDAAHVDQIKYVADSDGATTSFTQQAKFNLSNDSRTYDLGDYAFYPKDRNCDLTYSYNSSKETSSSYIELKESIQYNSEPTSVIPLLGKRDRTQEETTLGDGVTAGQAVTYKFKTITGALKIAIKDLPSKATSIRITGGVGDMLSGNFYLSEDLYNNGAYKTMDGAAVRNSYNTKTITFSGLSGDVDFYFPLPAGNISALTIEVLNGETVLLSKSMKAGKTLDITKGVITELPALTVPPYYEIGVRGTSTAPAGSFYKYNCITRFTVTNSSDTVDKNGYTEGNKFSANGTDSWTLADHFSGVLTSSGTYYLHYMVCKNVDGKNSLSNMTDAELIAQGSVPFYFLSAADASSICGLYARDVSMGTSSVEGFDLTGDNTITLSVSNNPQSGNIMITEFAGYCYDVSESTESWYSLDWSQFKDGSPIYGIYGDGIVYGGFPGATFAGIDQTVFYTDGGGHKHYVSTCTSSLKNLQFAFNSTEKGNGNSHDIVVHNQWIGNAYTTFVTGFDIYFTDYVGYKTKGQIALTKDMLSTNSSYGEDSTGDAGGMAALVDKKAGTSEVGKWWHSNWAGSGTTGSYGIYLQIDLGDSKTVSDFTLKFLTRGDISHGIPTKYRIAVSKNGADDWVFKTDEITIGDVDNAYANKWFQRSVSAGDDYRYIRLCITEMNHTNGGSSTVSLVNTTIGGSAYTHMGELQLWEN